MNASNGIRCRLAGAGIAALLMVSGGVGAASRQPDDRQWQRHESGGVTIEFAIRPSVDAAPLKAGDTAEVTFRVRDSLTGQPLAGVRPRAWIGARPDDRAPDEAQCTGRIRTLMAGQLTARAQVDLNSYLLVTLNHDNTVTLINPQVAFSRTKLESIVVLPARGDDWALSPDRRFLYISMPSAAAVAVVDIAASRVVRTLPMGEGSEPRRVVLQPDGRRVWVGLDGAARVAVIDVAAQEVAGTVPAGAGVHQIAFTDDGRYAYVSNAGADTVTAVDARRLARIADIPVGKTPVALAWSKARSLLYAVALNGASIAAIDPDTQQAIDAIPIPRGSVALRFEAEGRFGFVVNQLESRVLLLDAASNRIVASTPVVKEPDQIAFTDRYAYVRGIASERVSLIELREAAQGRLSPIEVTIGQRAPAAEPGEINVADMIAATPDGNSVMIASGPDKILYYYVEGMMAPMGSLQNYKRIPRALMVLDRSLRETAPGEYTAEVRLPGGGTFDVPLLLEQPRTTHCFQLAVAGPVERARSRYTLEVKPAPGERIDAGAASALRFQVKDPAGAPVTGLKDVRTLVFEPPGLWQNRQMAVEVGEGVYEIVQAFPRPGTYRLMIQAASRGIDYAEVPFVEFQVGGDRIAENRQGDKK